MSFKNVMSAILLGLVTVGAAAQSEKGAARGMCGARPSSAFQLVLAADCEETEYHGRGMPVRVSLDSVKHIFDLTGAWPANRLWPIK